MKHFNEQIMMALMSFKHKAVFIINYKIQKKEFYSQKTSPFVSLMNDEQQKNKTQISI